MFMQQLADAFWKKWVVFYFPSLAIQPKWHHEKRNMMVGDVVVIQDAKLSRGHWKTGRVSQVYTGVDGKVRRVTVQYKNEGSSNFTTVERSVQRLILLVPADDSTDPQISTVPETDRV